MKAAVCYEFGQPLVVEDVISEPPQPGEVQIRMKATAICHSDIHIIHGEFGDATPVIAGHEAAGIVEAVGEGVTAAKPGDAVVVSLLRSCGECFFCTRGSPNLCEASWPLDTDSRLKTMNGVPIGRGARVGSFAESVIVHQTQVVPLASDIPLDSASLLACGVITGVGAVLNTARVEAGSSVVVIGCGGVGMNSIQGARLAEAYPIIAVDMLDAKLEAARAFGATHGVNAAQNVKEFVRDMTEGRGADYVFVTVGSEQAVVQGFGLSRKKGTAVLVGLPGLSSTAAMRVFPAVTEERRVIGSFMGSTHLSTDVPKLVNWYREGKLKLDELITRRYPLEQINEAIADVESGHALRNVIMF